MTDSSRHTFVQYHSVHSGYKCGYCKSSDTNYSHGMHSFSMTVGAYQALIDRGWRRSGTYCYKPTMQKTCCPAYTIRCDALGFKPSKSQKKVLKRMHNFLAHGTGKPQTTDQKSQEPIMNDTGVREILPDGVFNHKVTLDDILPLQQDSPVSPTHSNQGFDSECPAVDDGTSSLPAPKANTIAGPSNSDATDTSSETSTSKKLKLTVKGPDPNKPLCRKAKLIRQERREAKLAANTSPTTDASKRVASNTPKSLEDFLNEPMPETPAHTLELKLVMPLNQEISKQRESHAVFMTYQQTIHGETEDACDFKCFYDFLIDSPLKAIKTSGGPECGYGSFHCQYWLDKSKLIAVAVIDILPQSVSSVYFYYDPEYAFLSLGTYSSLREIALTRELATRTPALRYYYMGFYIHSCPKMRYKGHYFPSYLLCPETYNWISIEKCLPKLNESKYSRLEEDQTITDAEAEEIDIEQTIVIRSLREMMLYANMRGRNARTDCMVKEYCSLVGKSLARKMRLYIP